MPRKNARPAARKARKRKLEGKPSKPIVARNPLPGPDIAMAMAIAGIQESLIRPWGGKTLEGKK